MHFLNNAVRRQVVVLSFVLAAGIAAAAQQQERTAVQDKYKWDLSRIYPTDQAWRAAKDTLAAQTPSVRAFKGTLTSSAQKLADALELNARLLKEYARLSTYASLMSDQDTRVSTSRRQRESHSAFFRGAGGIPRDLRRDDEWRGAAGRLLREDGKYNSSLESALDSANIPTSVYSRLVDSVNKALPTFHRYLALRKKMLGVDQLHYYDLYAPLVASVDPLTLTMQKMNHVMDEMEKILANTPAK